MKKPTPAWHVHVNKLAGVPFVGKKRERVWVFCFAQLMHTWCPHPSSSNRIKEVRTTQIPQVLRTSWQAFFVGMSLQPLTFTERDMRTLKEVCIWFLRGELTNLTSVEVCVMRRTSYQSLYPSMYIYLMVSLTDDVSQDLLISQWWELVLHRSDLGDYECWSLFLPCGLLSKDRGLSSLMQLDMWPNVTSQWHMNSIMSYPTF